MKQIKYDHVLVSACSCVSQLFRDISLKSPMNQIMDLYFIVSKEGEINVV